MNILAARLVFKVPITWMTGYYRLENAKLFHFIPAGGDGNFNIDLKFMTIEVIFTLKSTNTPLILSQMNSKMNNPGKGTVDSFGPQYNSTDAILNIDPRNVENETDRENRKFACLDVFEVGAHWRKASFKFDGLWKGLNHLTDFSLNQVIFRLFLVSYPILQNNMIY